MTQDRKDQLYEELFAWICEHIEDKEELFHTLHEQIGMTKEELHDRYIESLDEYFPNADPKELLKQKIDAKYAEYREKWLRMKPAELIEQCEEIEAVTRMAKELLSAVSFKDAEYLLRFQNPLEVVSDKWISRKENAIIVDDELSHLLWSLRDRREAEQDYPMEEAFSDPSMTM